MPPTETPLQERLRAMAETLGRVQSRGLDVPVAEAILFRTLLLLGRSLQQLADEAIRPTGLGEAEFRVLVQLYSQPAGLGHPGELCNGAAQSPASMTRITDHLVARGLISRIPSDQDRRRMVLQVTPAGEGVVRSVMPQAFEPVRQLFAGFDPGQRQQLQSLLGQLVDQWDALPTPVPSPAAALAAPGA